MRARSIFLVRWKRNHVQWASGVGDRQRHWPSVPLPILSPVNSFTEALSLLFP
ncbi:hypothetical protein [Synechocystis salina]|uniref:hypothetical protein n=1 Tax=Synechocystis salina TaxID=945780 RepID=UPI001D13A1B5|nr:hypothetical protein [Synechocystis salina]